MSNESIKRTLGVALAVCVVCSVLVSTATVALKPLQEANKAKETKKNILMAAGIYHDGIDIDQAFSKVEARLVDLKTGKFIEGDATAYDVRKMAKDPKESEKIPAKLDMAHIRTKAPKAVIYMIHKDGALETLILPIYGKGLWSTMYAFMALQGDGNTVKGLSFYDHGETPGLGGEVDNPRWKALWPGKTLFDQQHNLQIRLPKQAVDNNLPESIHQVDGLGGATLTTRGIENLIRFWMGSEGYGPLLKQIHGQGV